MKLFFSEFSADYSKYYFPYQVYALKESSDSFEQIYDQGFLPSRINKELFYLARSLRVSLIEYTPSSENRRIISKFPKLTVEMIPVSEFNYQFEIGKIASDFYKRRVEVKGMSAQKIKSLITEGYFTHILSFSMNGDMVGYCIVNSDEHILHYAYPFYKQEYEKSNMGMAMILSTIQLSQTKGQKYLYLGTVYTEQSLYKTQFTGAEYFNGIEWVKDIDVLKDIVRKPPDGHLFESIADKESTILNLIKSN